VPLRFPKLFNLRTDPFEIAGRDHNVPPGWVRTAWGETASTVWQDRARRESLLQRWGTAEDVAAAARWLASPAAAFVTGQVVRVNGGTVR